VNTVCPVSGKPIDPRYLIVYKGRVIGFCCDHCPSDFWADPEKYESKIR
jgi:YHS domain-containing protein